MLRLQDIVFGSLNTNSIRGEAWHHDLVERHSKNTSFVFGMNFITLIGNWISNST